EVCEYVGECVIVINRVSGILIIVGDSLDQQNCRVGIRDSLHGGEIHTREHLCGWRNLWKTERRKVSESDQLETMKRDLLCKRLKSCSWSRSVRQRTPEGSIAERSEITTEELAYLSSEMNDC